MLQAIRSKAGSFVVKILFGVLIVSFGVWGIGDIFRERTAAETTVAKVGGLKIQEDQLRIAVQKQMDRMRPLFGGNFGPEQAKQLGLVDTVLDQLVNADLLDLEARRLGLQAGDEVVREAIFANPSFHGSNGAFDRNTFNAILAANQMTEDGYVALLRRDLVHGFLATAIADGVAAPPALVEPLYRSRNEKRVADTVFIANDKIAGIADPTDAELQDFHDKHQDLFRAPEYRAISLVTLTPQDVVAGITIPEQKLRDAYQQRLDEFQSTEQRQVEQILVPDEAKAKAAEAQLMAGKDLAAVAKAVAGEEGDAIKLGWVKREEMPKALGDAAFALKSGEVSKPVKSPLGWHLIKVTAIKPGGTKPFDEVKGQLQKELALEAASDKLFEVSNQVEDALAGGATVEEVAKKFGFKLQKIAAVDPDGKTPEGGHVELAFPGILKTAFATDQGQTTRIVEAKDKGYYILRVDGVTPSRVRPLAEVKDRAKQLWLADKRNAAAEAEAKAMAAAANKGKPLADLAKEKQLTVATSKPVTRTGESAGLPADVVGRLFELKQGKAAAAAGKDGWYVVRLDAVQSPDPAADKPAVEALANQLSGGLRADILDEFTKALRARYTVTVDRTVLDRVL